MSRQKFNQGISKSVNLCRLEDCFNDLKFYSLIYEELNYLLIIKTVLINVNRYLQQNNLKAASEIFFLNVLLNNGFDHV